MKSVTVVALILSMAVLAGCAGNPSSPIADQCRNGVAAAYKQLDFDKAKGFDGTVEYTKAASLLGAAKIQGEFGKYADCIEKVHRAREYMARIGN